LIHPGYARGITLSGRLAYVADTESGLRILDISPYSQGVIEIDSNQINFGSVNLGESVAATLIISNIGLDYLTVTDIQVEGEYFSSDFSGEFMLEPSTDCEIRVTFAPEVASEYEGVLIMPPSDFENPELLIPLTGSG
jgi:hypothetical protein